MQQDEDLQSRLLKMKQIVPDKTYYALTLTAEPDCKPKWAIITHFTGWADAERRTEIRKPSVVVSANLCTHWEKTGEGYVVVNSLDDLRLYVLLGGNCLIETDLAEAHLPFICREEPAYSDNLIGFKSAQGLPKSAFVKAPSPKLRMDVIKRENYKCFLCGRSPSNYTDIELHVHHIKPFGKGGLTEPGNLITLCNTCHKGLEPHYDLNLNGLVLEKHIQKTSANAKSIFFENVLRYRRLAFKNFFQI